MMDSKLPQSNTAIKRQAIISNQGQRNFGGKLVEFQDNRERHFYQRMLKAYLRGDATFQFGQNKETKKPEWYNVNYTDHSIDKDALDRLLADGYTDPGKVFGGHKTCKSTLRKKIWDRIEAKYNSDNVTQKESKRSILQKLGLSK